ncbi:signal peptidase I [Thalassomonas haliotis]|uniref:Signal peptidase I n=1 Tax=Thalassomonas haliotis TaxID=485448 RepID=A0ABY7VBT8_9GAMM|nr:signal peptidase I [Thalassomonas haliotis]WDE10347.1 signal peptidase I [Thalassomonas haliotis]
MKLTQKLYLNAKEHYRFILFIALMLVFRSAVADWNSVPTGSMKPTIVEGDRILVNKMAYDLRLPFTNVSLLKLSDPMRGDIVIFDSKVSDIRLVKRVIGLPGDTVAMQDNILKINGEQLSYQALSQQESQADNIEYLPGMKHQIRVQQNGSSLSSFKEVTVPEGHYLVLGDNRDNSTDSRVIGFVPRNEIVGRSKTVVMSFDYDNYYLPRSERYLHTL